MPVATSVFYVKIFITEMALNIEPASYIENFLACKASPSEACFSFFCSLYNDFKL